MLPGITCWFLCSPFPGSSLPRSHRELQDLGRLFGTALPNPTPASALGPTAICSALSCLSVDSWWQQVDNCISRPVRSVPGSPVSLGNFTAMQYCLRKCCWALVAHTYNPSYLGGWDQKDHGLRPVWANSSWRPHLQNNQSKMELTCGSSNREPVLQAWSPESKPQSHISHISYPLCG
jgi:hypothetical protein